MQEEVNETVRSPAGETCQGRLVVSFFFSRRLELGVAGAGWLVPASCDARP